ncbi:MAG: ABC transporter ATP-binding protein [Alistipes sp.]|nr:ABC transporter ATP-binding protein [Alistipes sp.]
MNAIETHHLSHCYGAVQALRDVTLSIPQGELFGVIGADGAGKSTLFRILTTLLIPDEGRVTLNGLDAVRDYRAIRRIVGYMPGRFSLYGDLTVEENLQFFASVFGTSLSQNRRLIEDIYVQIEPFRRRRAAQLSGGMKQKLALCCALIHAPSVLILDEPTTGVDPVSRREFWQILQRLRQQGITIVASTPYMDEARRCDRIAFLREGVILYTDTPQGIVDHFGEPLYAITADPMHALLDAVRCFPGVLRCYAFGESHHFTLAADRIDALRTHLEAQGYHHLQLQPIQPTIEDCYLKLSQS